MKVRVKKLRPNAVIPKYAKPGDAGLDLTVVQREIVEKEGLVIYDTGLALEIPKGYVGLIFPRSSSYKKDVELTNCVGVIDSGYRGSVKAFFRFTPVGQSIFDARKDNKLRLYEVGDRALQMIILPYPEIELEEAEELSDSERGDGGFGSTGA